MAAVRPAFHAVDDVRETGAAFGEIRRIDLRDIPETSDFGSRTRTCDERLHLLGREILRFVDDEILVDERASAHEVERLHFDARPYEIARSCASPFAGFVIRLVEHVEVVLER